MYQPGSWAWDSERKEAVQIVEELSLWDTKVSGLVSQGQYRLPDKGELFQSPRLRETAKKALPIKQQLLGLQKPLPLGN